MRFTAACRTDVGQRRDHNEDAVLVDAELGLYMVCDGMGGHAAGEVASAKAIEAVRALVSSKSMLLRNFDDSAGAHDGLLRLVDQAAQEASKLVHETAKSEQGKAGMGTTMTLLLVVKHVAVMAHVGDSRLYMRRGNKLHQLSEDHTYVNEIVKRGGATLEEAKAGPYANVITRAIGIQPTIQADTLLFDVLPGDTFLLCSDGLYRHVDADAELVAFLQQDSLDAAAEQLVQRANERGGSDNISVVVVRAAATPEDGDIERSRTTEVNLRIDAMKDLSLFRNLDMTELCHVLNVVRVAEYHTGEDVVVEGDSGDSLYCVVQGTLLVTRDGHLVATLEPGAHFGEMSLFNSRPRSATVTAQSSAKLLVMDRTRFFEILRKEQAVAVKLLWSFAQVLSLRLDETSDLLTSTVSMREHQLPSPFSTLQDAAPVSVVA
jgi:serine/threonine protein phosphatase PrpC/CRP-like cAMP-binding protein